MDRGGWDSNVCPFVQVEWGIVKRPRSGASARGPADWIGVDMAEGTCSVPGCETPSFARGWCQKHYARWYRHGTTVDAPPRVPVTCTVPDCDQPSVSKGLCARHDRRMRRRGRLDLPTAEERFWAKVNRQGPVECWLWIGAKMPNGYGSFGATAGTKGTVYAHRYAYTLLVGPIPEGLWIDHLCRIRLCVNPAHLEPVTPRENLMRGNGPAAINARKEHCPQGHPYDEANTEYVISRRCRTCRSHRRRE